MFQNGPSCTFIPYLKLAAAYERMGDMESAVMSMKQALKFCPDNKEFQEKYNHAMKLLNKPAKKSRKRKAK